MDGHQVVYEYQTAAYNRDIRMKNLVNGASNVVSNSSYDEANPDISGNRVVWEKYVHGISQVWYRDMGIRGSTAKALYSSTYNQYKPKISGDKIVWYQGPYSTINNGLRDYNIVLYNLNTSTYSMITNANSTEMYPHIEGSTVVYQKWDKYRTRYSIDWQWHWQVYKYQIGNSTNSGTKIWASIEDQYSPVVSSNGKAAWTERGEIGSGIPFLIRWVDNVWKPTICNNESSTGHETSPAICGNTLVFGSNQNIVIKSLSRANNTWKTVANYADDQAVGMDSYGTFVAYEKMVNNIVSVYWRNMDTIAPSIVSTVASEMTYYNRIAVGFKKIVITFSEPIKTGSNFGNITVYRSDGTTVSISKMVSGKQLIITAASGFSLMATYKILIPYNGIRDYANNYLTTNKIYYYTYR